MLSDTVVHYVTEYRYLGIFVMFMFGLIGIPFPEETVLAFAGYMVQQGRLALLPTYAAAWLGTTCGITVSYALGRFLGLKVINRYGWLIRVTPERMQRVHGWFDRRGKWVLTLGYFVPGVRHLFAVVAGSSRVPWHVFALFAYAGGLVWSIAFITLGYLLGEAWEKAARGAFVLSLALVVASLVAVAGYFLYRRARRLST